MKTEFEEIINSHHPTLESLMRCVEMVKQNGDIVVLKLDGERKENHYTAFITFPLSKKKEMIRADKSTLEEALLKILTVYLERW